MGRVKTTAYNKSYIKKQIIVTFLTRVNSLFQRILFCEAPCHQPVCNFSLLHQRSSHLLRSKTQCGRGVNSCEADEHQVDQVEPYSSSQN